MACAIIVHLTGRGKVDNGDWEPGDIVDVLPARLNGNDVELTWENGRVGRNTIGKKADRLYLTLFLPDAIYGEMLMFKGRGTKYLAAGVENLSRLGLGAESQVIRDPERAVPPRRGGAITRSILPDNPIVRAI